MLKFFRTYIANKYVIISGMVLLMIVFLLPFGGRILQPDPRARTIGQLGDRELTVSDRRTAAAEIQLLGAVQRNVYSLMQQNRQLMQSPGDLGLFFQARPPRDPLRWLLITEEARRNGIYVSRARARSVLQQLREAGVDVSGLIQRAQASESFFLRALQHWAMYVQLRNLVDGGMASGGQRPSGPRLRHFAQGIRSQATVNLVPVDAARLMDEVEEPSEEELQEHFEQYKDNPPGESEPYGFGYRLPPRVKLEYLAVPLERVAETIEIDEVDAHRYYLENRDEFRPSPEEQEADQEQSQDQDQGQDQAGAQQDGGSADSGDESETGAQGEASTDGSGDERADGEASDAQGGDGASEEAPPAPRPYAEVREQVIEKLTDQRARAKRKQIIQWLTATLNERRRGLEKGQQGYFKLGEDYQPPSFERLAERVQERFGVLPDMVRLHDDWIALEDIAELEGLGAASLQQSNREVSVREYVASVPKLKRDVPQHVASLKLQVGVASHPVANEQGTEYLFRVTSAEPAHAPESLAVVRDRVARDVKRLKAYRLLSERAEEFRQRGVEEGLEALAESLGAEVTEVGPFSGLDFASLMMQGDVQRPDLDVVGRSERFIREVFELARQVRNEGGLEQVEPAKTIAAVPVDGTQQVVVAQLTDYQPIDNQTYERLKPRLVQMMGRAGLGGQGGGEAEGPLSQKALAKRLNFQSAEEPDDAGGGQQGQGSTPTSTLH